MDRDFVVHAIMCEDSDTSYCSSEPETVIKLTSYANNQKLPSDIPVETPNDTAPIDPDNIPGPSSTVDDPGITTIVVDCITDETGNCSSEIDADNEGPDSNSLSQSSASEHCQHPIATDKPKKRKRGSNKRQQNKEKRLRKHVSGPSCTCELLKCFENVTEDERLHLVTLLLNDFKTLDEQNAYLSTMIIVNKTNRPKPASESLTKKRQFSYEYWIPVLREGVAINVRVYHKAFMSIFGITNRRTQTLKLSLATTGRHIFLFFVVLFIEMVQVPTI